MSDFIYTLDSEPESDIENQEDELELGGPTSSSGTTKAKTSSGTKGDLKSSSGAASSSKNAASSSKSKKTKKSTKDEEDDGEGVGTIDPTFDFDVGGVVSGFYEGMAPGSAFEAEDEVRTGTKPAPMSVDDIIARRRKENPTKLKSLKRKRGKADAGGDQDHMSLDEDEGADEEMKDLELNDLSADEGFGAGASDEGEEVTDEEEDPLAASDDEGGESDEEDPKEELDEGSDDDSDARSTASGSSVSSTASQKAQKDAFFAPSEPAPTSSSTKKQKSSDFNSLNLSRPLIRALTAMSFSTPTPIQSRTIPLALAGQDVLGSAQTGSGKTLAFLIPTLERLMYRERKSGKGRGGEIRVLILVPTRELAVQCADVGKSLARFTDITFGVIVGGLSSKAQEATLRARPDILVATPGRLIDHLQNTVSFSLAALDILILDEADRMLSDGFAAELTEIIKACPTSGGEGGTGRQTMLFSATMSDEVDRLVQLSMQRPVRLFVDPKKSLARNLVQEFVRVKRESERRAILLTLCVRTANRGGTIVFLRSKKLAHQMRVVFGLLGLRATELHGDLTQDQRLNSLKSFKAKDVDYLLATDVASRGLDIDGISSVINYDMPAQIELYVHRVGRTARAGEHGRAISLVGEADRVMLKAVIKRSSKTEGSDESIRHRLVPDDAIKAMAARLEDITDEVAEVLKEEKEEKEIRRAEMEITKGQNILEHEEEIFSRPKKTWFTSSKEKAAAENLSKQEYASGFKDPESKAKSSDAAQPTKHDKFAGLSRKLKRRKMAAEADKEFNDTKVLSSSIRAAKRGQRPKKIGDESAPAVIGKKKKAGRGAGGKKTAHTSVKSKVLGKGSSFASDMGGRRGGGGSSAATNEGMRAKKGDGGVLGGKKGGKGKAGGGGGKHKGRR